MNLDVTTDEASLIAGLLVIARLKLAPKEKVMAESVLQKIFDQDRAALQRMGIVK